MSKRRCVRWKRDYVMRPGSAAPTPDSWPPKWLDEDEARFQATVSVVFGESVGLAHRILSAAFASAQGEHDPDAEWIEVITRTPPPGARVVEQPEWDDYEVMSTRPCVPSVDTARSCKRAVDRRMLIDGGRPIPGRWDDDSPAVEAEPEGPWRCEEYDDE